LSLRHKDLLGLEPLSSEEIALVLDTAEPCKQIFDRQVKKVSHVAGQGDRQSLLRGEHPDPHLL